jgi:hypothetical protein
MSHPWALVLVALVGAAAAAADPPKAEVKAAEKTPPELGRVPFLRDYPAAMELAKKEKKPLFVLFDEVPG